MSDEDLAAENFVFPIRKCPVHSILAKAKRWKYTGDVSSTLTYFFQRMDSETTTITLENLSEYIVAQTKFISPCYLPAAAPDGYDVNPNDGRMGPSEVKMDRRSCGQGDTSCIFSDDMLSLQSNTNFISCRANVCVFKGKWVYEVTLGTAGIQQLGWATIDCQFTPENGVGDAPNSFAYDGKRKKLWNVGAKAYGSAWVPGDKIGCAIDIDEGVIEYFRNGVSMGVACSTVVRGPGYAYFPTVSLSRNERCRLNFGATPICYAQQYRPLEHQNVSHQPCIDYLLIAMGLLITAPTTATTTPATPPPTTTTSTATTTSPPTPPPTTTATTTLPGITTEPGTSTTTPTPTGATETAKSTSNATTTPTTTTPPTTPPPLRPTTTTTSTSATPLTTTPTPTTPSPVPTTTTPNVATTPNVPDIEVLLTYCKANLLPLLAPLLSRPYVVSILCNFLCMALTLQGPQIVKRWCDLISLLEESMIDKIVCQLFTTLASNCETTAPWAGGVRFVQFAAELLKSKMILASWLRLPSRIFDKQLEGLLTVKLAGQDDRNTVLPVVYWEGSNLEEEIKIAFDQRLAQLHQNFADLEEAHKTIILHLTDENLLTSTIKGGIRRSPFMFFQQWLENLINTNSCDKHRGATSPSTADHTVLTSVQGALMRLFVDRLSSSCPSFQDKPDEVSNWLASHIHDRVFVDEVLSHSHFQRVGGGLRHVRREHRLLVNANSENEEEEEITETTVEFELFSRSILLFDLALSQPYRRLQQGYADVARALRDEEMSHARLEKARARVTDNGAVALLAHADNVFRDFTKESVQCMVLLELAYLGRARLSAMELWLDCIVGVLDRMYTFTHFTFVPEALINTAMQAFTIVGVKGNQLIDIDPFFVTSDYRKAILQRFTALLVKLVTDKRIVTPDLSGSMLLCVKSILGVAAYLRCIETNTELCRQIQITLLECYNGRLWVLATDILVRFWAGEGFAYHACSLFLDADDKTNNVKCASLICREKFTEICVSQPDVVNKFLNELINNVNMTASEFDQSLEMIRKADDSITENGHEYYRKCMIMFEVTVHLLRLLEGTVQNGSNCYNTIKATSSMNLDRIIALLLHMIDRSSASKLYDGVMQAHPTLISLRKELLMCPIFGTLMVLTETANTTGVVGKLTKDNRVVAAIVNNGSLKLTHLDCENYLASFKGLKETELNQIESFTKQLRLIIEDALQHEDDNAIDEDLICTICYCNPLDVTLIPCNHRSCAKCIERHLLNDTKCFFCNAVVDRVQEDAAAV